MRRIQDSSSATLKEKCDVPYPVQRRMKLQREVLHWYEDDIFGAILSKAQEIH
jgi:hypothetical protein